MRRLLRISQGNAASLIVQISLKIIPQISVVRYGIDVSLCSANVSKSAIYISKNRQKQLMLNFSFFSTFQMP